MRESGRRFPDARFGTIDNRIPRKFNRSNRFSYPEPNRPTIGRLRVLQIAVRVLPMDGSSMISNTISHYWISDKRQPYGSGLPYLVEIAAHPDAVQGRKGCV